MNREENQKPLQEIIIILSNVNSYITHNQQIK